MNSHPLGDYILVSHFVSYMLGTMSFNHDTIKEIDTENRIAEVRQHHVIDGNGVFATQAISVDDHVCFY